MMDELRIGVYGLMNTLTSPYSTNETGPRMAVDLVSRSRSCLEESRTSTSLCTVGFFDISLSLYLGRADLIAHAKHKDTRDCKVVCLSLLFFFWAPPMGT